MKALWRRKSGPQKVKALRLLGPASPRHDAGQRRIILTDRLSVEWKSPHVPGGPGGAVAQTIRRGRTDCLQIDTPSDPGWIRLNGQLDAPEVPTLLACRLLVQVIPHAGTRATTDPKGCRIRPMLARAALQGTARDGLVPCAQDLDLIAGVWTEVRGVFLCRAAGDQDRIDLMLNLPASCQVVLCAIDILSTPVRVDAEALERLSVAGALPLEPFTARAVGDRMAMPDAVATRAQQTPVFAQASLAGTGLLSGWVLADPDPDKLQIRAGQHEMTATASVDAEVAKGVQVSCGFALDASPLLAEFGVEALDLCLPDTHPAAGSPVLRLQLPRESQRFILEAAFDPGLRLTGLVLDRQQPNHVFTIEVCDATGRVVAAARADRPHRLPGPAEGPAQGHGFVIDLPQWLLDGQSHDLVIRAQGVPVVANHITIQGTEAGMGQVEAISPDLLTGWALIPSDPATPVTVVASVGERLIGHASANQFRPDLTRQFRVTGFQGFSIAPISPLSLADLRNLSVRIGDTGAALPMPAAVPDTAPSITSPAQGPSGRLERVDQSGVRGWAIDPANPTRPCVVNLIVDGVAVGSALADLPRPDLTRTPGESGLYGFHVPFPPGMALPDETRVEVRLDSDGAPVAGSPQIYRPRRRGWPVPARQTGRVASPAVQSCLYVPKTGTTVSGDPPSFALIVLNRNGAAHLQALFDSFARCNRYPNYRFIVIDHGSEDGSQTVCADWSDRLQITLVQREGNHGFSSSNNLGASMATEDIVLFLNNDILLDRCILTPLAPYFDDPRIGAVGIQLVSPIRHADGGNPLPGFVQHLGIRFGHAPDRPAIAAHEIPVSPAVSGIVGQTWRVPAVTAAAMAMRRNDFGELGGFDERYFYGYEDVDLCLGIRENLRKEVICATGIVAFHVRGATRSREDRETRRRFARNLDLLSARFGAQVRQKMRQDLLKGGGFWRTDPFRVAFVVGSDDMAAPDPDLRMAMALGDALMQAHGWQVRCLPPKDWYDLAEHDLVVVMNQSWNPQRIEASNPGLLRIAWTWGNVDHWLQNPWLTGFDMIWATSDRAKTALQTASGLPVVVVRAASDLARAAAARPEPAFLCDYCVTGDFAWMSSSVLAMLGPAGLPFRFGIFGTGWSQIGWLAPYWNGPLAGHDMSSAHASTRLVIDGGNDPTNPWGAVDDRVFDALAAGALVLSSNQTAAQEVFDGLLPVYRNQDELESLIHQYLENEPLHTERVSALRAKVLAAHGWQHRADTVCAALQQLCAGLRFGLRDGNGSAKRATAIMQIAANVLRARGCWVRVADPKGATRPEELLGDDVVIHVTSGSFAADTTLRPDQVNVRLHLGSPDDLSLTEARRFDLLLLATDEGATHLSNAGIPVSMLFADPTACATVLAVDDHGNVVVHEAEALHRALVAAFAQLGDFVERLHRTQHQTLPQRLTDAPDSPDMTTALAAERFVTIAVNDNQHQCRLAGVDTPSGRVAAVVLHYAHVEDTIRCVNALLAQRYAPLHVVIVSNDESDGAFATLARRFPGCTVIQSPRNMGYAAGNNIGLSFVRQFGFDIFWLVNPDTVAPPDYLDRMVTHADLHPNVSIFGSLILYGDQPDRVWFAGGRVTWHNGLQSAHLSIGSASKTVPGNPVPSDYVTGASLLFRSVVLDRIGYLPEDYFLYFEETQWCLDAAGAGLDIVTFPDVALLHYKRSEAGGAPTPDFLYYYLRNALVLCARFRPDKMDATERQLRVKSQIWLGKVHEFAPDRLAASKAAVDLGFLHGLAQVRGQVDLPPAHAHS